MNQVETEKFIRIEQAISMTTLSRSRIYAMMKTGEFPMPVKLSRRFSAWPEKDVQDWLREKIEARSKSARAAQHESNGFTSQTVDLQSCGAHFRIFNGVPEAIFENGETGEPCFVRGLKNLQALEQSVQALIRNFTRAN